MQGYDPVLLSFIITSIVTPIEIVLFYFFLGRNHRNIEFRVAVGITIIVAILCYSLTWYFGIMLGDVIASSIVAVFLFLLPLYIIYVLVKAVRKNRLNYTKIIESGQEDSINLSNMATELAASANEVSSSAAEVSSTTQQVSLGTQTQVKQLVDIDRTSSKINDLALNMKKSSDDIRRIMNIIENIAEQTNLLALNASIEAGRAGEYGRGFAVVADEVRKLAEESKNTVGNSSQIVASVLAMIDETVNLVGSITSAIKNAVATSEETASAMETISSSAEQQMASMEEISATSNRLGELSEKLKDLFEDKEKIDVKKDSPKH